MKILQGYHLTVADRKIIKAFVENDYEIGYSVGTPQITFKLLERENNRLKFKRYQYGGWSTASDKNGKIIEVSI